MEEFWKRGKRELLMIYKDEYGTQYLFFYVTKNKRFRFYYNTIHNTQLSFLRTLRDYVIGPEWKKLEEGDYVLR